MFEKQKFFCIVIPCVCVHSSYQKMCIDAVISSGFPKTEKSVRVKEIIGQVLDFRSNLHVWLFFMFYQFSWDSADAPAPAPAAGGRALEAQVAAGPAAAAAVALEARAAPPTHLCRRLKAPR